MNLVSTLRDRLPSMLEDLEHLVTCESPSEDLAATAQCAEAVSDLGQRLLGQPAESVRTGDRVHLRWRFGSGDRVAMIGHLDTVWPLGTIDRWPFAVHGERATGPGAFDMKAGIVAGLHALTLLDDLDGVTFLITSDEELGSLSSRQLVEELGRTCSAALVLEPPVGPAVKTVRKGVSLYQVVIEGRAAHAGLEPELGANALIELAHQVLAIEEIARSSVGTTVTPTIASAGSASNVVPATARINVDVRAKTSAEQLRVHDEISSLRPAIAGTRLTVSGGPNRPPLPEVASARLFARARELAKKLDLPELEGAAVGGGSDGNFTAGVGCETLDGLGAVGAGAHAEGEHIVIDSIPPRTALIRELVADVLSGG